MRCIGYPLTYLSIPSFTILAVLLLGYSGYIFLYFKLIEYRVSSGIEQQEIILKSWIASTITIYSMILGIYIFSKLLNVKSINARKSHSITYFNLIEITIVLLVFITCILVLFLYLSKVPKIALLTAILSVDEGIEVMRSDMGNNFSGKYHWYSLFMHELSALIAFSFFANYLIKKNSVTLFLFIISFLYVSFTTLMATEKAPFAWFIIGLFLTFTIVKNENNFKFSGILLIFLLSSIFLVFAYKVFMGSGDITSALQHIFSRIFTAGIGASYFYLQFFPQHHDYLLGRSFPNPAGIFNFEHYQLTVEIMKWRFPEEARLGIVGSSPTVFWGELYANFGWIGLFPLPVFVGFILVVWEYLKGFLIFNPIGVGFSTWLILHFKDLSSTGITEYVIDMPLWILFLFVLFMIYCINKKRCMILH